MSFDITPFSLLPLAGTETHQTRVTAMTFFSSCPPIPFSQSSPSPRVRRCPFPRPETPRTRNRGRPRRRRHILHAPVVQPITWPEEFKQAAPTGRPICLDSSTPFDAAFFTNLHYDARLAVYGIILAGAGFHQHIFCPSVSRAVAGGQVRQLYDRYLVSRKVVDLGLISTLACGHLGCEIEAPRRAGGREHRYGVGDLLALAKTCRFAYLEITDYLYRTVTFTFASFAEMRAFIDYTPASLLNKIRKVAFIAHALPLDPKVCMDFIQGSFFQREGGEDAIELFKRFGELRRLEVNFYPSPNLAISWELGSLLKPLEQMRGFVEEDVIVRLPWMMYGGASVALPATPRIPSDGGIRLERPGMRAGTPGEMCKAYFFQVA